MPQVQVVQIHSPEQVRAIVSEAITIAAQAGPVEVSPDVLFRAAVDLLGARIPLQPAPVGPLTVPSLGLRG